ncbi:NAD(P)H nitroreductase [Alginatibacterium sediminis]|uniref:Putative NAD(P)H nitroreductase n=1 Tax=Alginatibacterium sediminis TaxID=2164068 RepID=A0A420EIE7_9ALTE|nr:NAD(P)H nitroreductase [Alginatibacterium sediminis]RKF20427.1 NAD(P)H nitroreductase [Alginatibacterium sediminis]
MDALELLLNRQSCARLAGPSPEGTELETIWQAGLRVPDHGGLHPWRFIHVSGEGLDRLSEIFSAAALNDGSDVEKAKLMPYRAPVITIVVSSPRDHDKVPQIEQLLSAGCCVQAMQMCAQALGYNGIWRTGAMAYSKIVNEELGLLDHESVVGFLYLGAAMSKAKKPRQHSISDFVSSI